MKPSIKVSMKALRYYCALFPVLLMSAACNVSAPHVPVLFGNYFFGQGDYQEAGIRYLEALQKEQYTEWLQYNLANVYHSFGEFDAALDLWDKASHSDSKPLLFNIHYNRGILLYEQSRYEEAFEDFKMALIHDPGNVDAKLNLELTLSKLQAGRTAGTQRQNQPRDSQDISAESIRIFEYIRRKEQQLWQEATQSTEFLYIEDW